MPPIRIRLKWSALRGRFLVAGVALLASLLGVVFAPVAFSWVLCVWAVTLFIVASLVEAMFTKITVEAPVVNAGTVYPNNTHVDGAGWFHARSGRFYPHPFNHRDPARGFFRDGEWFVEPAPPVASAIASESAARDANAAILEHARRGGFGTMGESRGSGG